MTKTSEPPPRVVSVRTDETQAPPGRGDRRRRAGASRHRGTLIRLEPAVHAQLENEARTTGASKVSIIEDALRARYGVAA